MGQQPPAASLLVSAFIYVLQIVYENGMTSFGVFVDVNISEFRYLRLGLSSSIGHPEFGGNR